MTKNVTAVAFTSIGGRPFLSHPVTTVYPMRLAYLLAALLEDLI